MNIISKNFSIYLNNVYDYNTVLGEWKNSFEYIYSIVRNGNYISKDFRLDNTKYPIYPLLFKFISAYEKYDINKIRETLLISSDELLSSIDNNTINLKVRLDQFPNNVNDFKFDVNLQRTYFTQITELYNKNNYFLDFLKVDNYDNIVYSLMGNSYENLDSQAKELQITKVTYSFTVLYFLCTVLPSICDIKYKLPFYIIDNARFSKTRIHEEFDNFLNSYTIQDVQWTGSRELYGRVEPLYDSYDNKVVTNKLDVVVIDLLKYNAFNGPPMEEYILGENIILDTIIDNTDKLILDSGNNYVITFENARTNREIMTKELSKIILRNIYNSISPSENIINIVANGLSSIIGKLPVYFDKFLESTNSDPLLDISELLMSCIFHIISVQELKYLCHNYEFIPRNEKDDILSLDRETQIINSFLNRVSSLNMKQYLLISFLYKHCPIKFLSSISILIKSYVENEIMSIDERFLTENDTLSIIRELDDPVFYDMIVSILDTRLNTTMIFETCNKYQLSRFVISYFFMNMFDGFIDSDEFNTFIEDIIRQSSDILFENKYITRDFNWYECIDSLKLYFKAFLRFNLIDGELFKSFIINLNEDILYILQDTNFNYNKDTLRNDFKSFYNNKLNISNIHNFIMNLYLGTVTKQILYDVLKFFLI